MNTLTRAVVPALLADLRRFPELLHILTGPRQVGKTTTALQLVEQWPGPSLYAAADELAVPGPEWVVAQ